MPTKRETVAPLVDLHGRTAWSILPALLAGFFMIMIDTTIVNIAVPTLQSKFDASLTEVGWVNSAYLLTFAVLLLVTGRLGDKFGQKPVFITGMIVFTLSSLACGLSGHIGSTPQIGWLIAFRAVQGVGGSLMTPQTQAMITRVFPPRQRGTALGMWGAVAGVATITGPLLGGVLVEYASWEWIFYVNIPIGAVALWLSFGRLPHLPTQARSMDGLGIALSVAGMFLMIFGLQEGDAYNWGEVRWGITVWELIGTGVVLLVLFVVLQARRGDDALLPTRLFRNRNFLLSNVAAAAVSFAMIGIFFPFTLFLQQIMGLSPLRAALLSLPGSLVSGLVAPVAGRLSDRIAGKWMVAFGFASFTVSILWIAAWVDPDVTPWRLLAPMAVFGLGTGFVMSPLANIATSGLDQRTAGAGAGAFNTNRQIGGVVGSAAIIAMLTSRLTATIASSAKDAATTLPEAFRAQFVAAFAHAGSSVGGFGSSSSLDLPSSVPAEAAAAIKAAATTAVHHGFATAASETTLLAAAVTLLGMTCALLMRGGRTHHDLPVVAPAETPAVEPA